MGFQAGRESADGDFERVNIRRASPRDAPAIAALHVAAWHAAYRGQVPDEILDGLDVAARTQFWSNVLLGEHNVSIAEADRAVFGFYSLIPSRDPDSDPVMFGEIATFYICPSRWRRGIGRDLFRHALAVASSNQFTGISLWVLASNTPAIRFYEAMGFIADGTEKREADSSGCILPEIRMRYELPTGYSSRELTFPE